VQAWQTKAKLPKAEWLIFCVGGPVYAQLYPLTQPIRAQQPWRNICSGRNGNLWQVEPEAIQLFRKPHRCFDRFGKRQRYNFS
jgi:hypothetical protein